MNKQQKITHLRARGFDVDNKTSAKDLDTMLADAPEQTNTSLVQNPVRRAHEIATEMFREAAANKQPAPRRKDVVARMQAEGIAYYTARTQYQVWYKVTERGTKLPEPAPAAEEQEQSS